MWKIIFTFISLIKKVNIKIYNKIIKPHFLNMDGCIIAPHQLMGEKYISIGKGTTINEGSILTAWDKYEGQSFTPSIKIGNNCCIGEHAHISACKEIIIGNNVLTGRRIYISDNSHGNCIKEEIEIDESLVSRLNVICDFCNTTPIIENGSIRKIEHTNLTYIEPHRIIIKNKLYLAFNYSNEIYVHNLGKKIKLSELEQYIKEN